MTAEITRRATLAGLLASAGSVAAAEALTLSPLPRARPGRPATWDDAAHRLIAKSGLGGTVSFAMADAESGEILAAEYPDLLQPPASTAKAITALYALDRLGPDHRFETQLIGTGPVVNGQLKGDLVLAGSGDPVFDSDDLGAMAAGLKERGVFGVEGRFLIWDGALPWVERIASEQPETAGYNPTITGLNLNFNRVHFEWKKAKSDYEITLQARAARFRPSVTVSTMDIVDERLPVYTYREEDGLDRWTVARHALGNDGARWLPVRRPVAYAGEAFQSVARSHGLELARAERAWLPPEGEVLVRHFSSPLVDILRGMLRYSTNLTAEVAGLHASAAAGGMPGSLYGSAAAMNDWVAEGFGAKNTLLIDHSGLGYASRMAAGDMVRILAGAAGDDRLRPILRPVNLGDANHGATALAKTGTHNFVSALAGYLAVKSGRRLAFAVFCADAARRDAIPVAFRERPQGSRSYARRARRLQKDLLRLWAGRLAA
ncbi:MAG: D-alanyl-D-alanine carboxypeptidase/D-alanyl-D-alanine-endopeptidase [Paracoccaceae bacterium]|nr:D-alanyl-D-alanine carboxypeptidase/D-alanyl-D-alanine-endopeptidase [Paracoccaceae bacterium]